MSALVWGAEWRVALSNSRGFAFLILAPLAMAVVVATGAMSRETACAVYTASIVVFGVMRTSFGVLRDEETGLSLRILRGGVSPSAYLLQRAAAGGSIALVGLLPAVAAVVFLLRASVLDVLVLLGALVGSLWLAGLIGVGIAVVSRTAVEVLILCSVTSVVLLHMSGVFDSPGPMGQRALLEAASPFRFLHESFMAMHTRAPVAGAASAVLWAVVLAFFVGLVAPGMSPYSGRGR